MGKWVKNEMEKGFYEKNDYEMKLVNEWW
nr:cortex morphogenetic protein CmpA [Bacillus sp. WP8]